MMRFNIRNSAWRTAIAVACASALSACGSSGSGGSGGFNPGGFGTCNPGTDVQLANPSPNSYGVSTNIGSITIVANGNGNQLYNTYASWNLVLQGNLGDSINGGSLNLVPRNGTQPFPSDFYYSSSVPGLPSGEGFTVLLVNENASCSGVTIGNFST